MPGKKELVKEEKKQVDLHLLQLSQLKISLKEKFLQKNIWVKRPGNGYFSAENTTVFLEKNHYHP